MEVLRTVKVKVRDGLHARPATQFVKLAKSFAATVEIEREGKVANAKSSVKLMLLAIKEQDDVVLRANGDDAETAVAELAAFMENPEAGLEEDGAEPAAFAALAGAAAPIAFPAQKPAQTEPPAGAETTRGLAASEGVALGAVFPFFPEPLRESTRLIESAGREAERVRYRTALDATVDALGRRRSEPSLSAQDVGILDALMDVARDTDLIGDTEARIAEGADALTAILRAGRQLAESFEAVDDPYIRARAEDVRSIVRNVGLTLENREDVSLERMPRGAIVLADEIGAWDLAKADLGAIGGIVCRQGTPTSHVSIMPRAHGIPAVVGFACPAERLRSAGLVALDGSKGEVLLDPDSDTQARYQSAIAEAEKEKRALQHLAGVEPRTRSGAVIEVAANLGTLKEIEAARRVGAMGVGLFRTEFLFMERPSLPSEDEQAEVYAKLAEAFAPHPVIIRTLDIGGDKPVAGIEFPPEENPFLGWRGVRMCLERTDVFMAQLKALLRASLAGNLKVMIPMIADVGEIRAVKALVETCRSELAEAGVPHGTFQLGIMVETPAAALTADDLARETDFFSIGTNDLTQYVMAADRLNPRVAALNKTEHPAVMTAVRLTCEAAARAGIPVGICGEAASRPDLIPEFVRLGVTELSMSPAAILRAKRCVMELE